MPSNITITMILFSLIAVVAGSLVPFQAGSNAILGKMLGHPLWAAIFSLIVSLIVVLPIALAMKIPKININGISDIPLWAWSGGISGVIFITSSLLLTPRLGATTFIVCVITGQVVVSLIIDNFGLMGLPVKEINPGRIFGVMLIVFGMILVQHFTVSNKKAYDVKVAERTITSSDSSIK